ncbi:ribokinase [Georgenia halophila]|uniref:Ribokinase n=1 Tax=Georgenia halophila TaxID=620889 RepID=A0ABP8LK97_9MICO
MTGSVVVVGSANVDVVVDVPRHPQGGETILGGNLRRTPGGKGANQAVAAARAGGADVSFVGALGRDDDAQLLLDSLTGAGVRTDLVRASDAATGTALISVTGEGENTIIVAPGANSAVAVDDEVTGRIRQADVVLAQLEIPLDVVLAAARARSSARFVLNAAPSRALPEELLAAVDVLIVNEHEARDLAGTDGDPESLAATLLEKVATVVVTLGAAGALIAERDAEPVHVPAPTVTAVDTTGAGDAFCGVFAAALANGTSTHDAARVACVAGALAATRPGAQAAMPAVEDVSAAAR